MEHQHISINYIRPFIAQEEWDERTDEQLELMFNSLSSSQNNIQSQKTRQRSPQKTTSLLSLALTHRWQRLAEFAPSYPQELEVKHHDGSLPLHIVCRCADICNTDVLRTLLKVAPHTAGIPDNEGSTPLHALLQFCNPKMEELQLLIDACPEALAKHDIYGRTPLYHAMEKNLCLNKVKIIMQYSGAVARTLQCCGPDSEGKYLDPIHSQWSLGGHLSVYTSSQIDTERTPLYIAWRKTLMPLDRTDFKTRGKRWAKAVLLLRKTYFHKHPEETKFLLPHALFEFLPYLPYDLHDFLFTISQHAIKQPAHASGQLPLHIVASLDMDDDEVIYLIDRLLSIYPEAIGHKSLTGRLPFHEAVASGASLRICSRLYKNCTDVLGTVDPITGLYPFMLAAASSRSGPQSEEKKQKNDIEPRPASLDERPPDFNDHLTAIYELTLLNCGLFANGW